MSENPIQPSRKIQWRSIGDIGYLKLPSFTQDFKVWDKHGRSAEGLDLAIESTKNTLSEALRSLEKHDTLILDLRNNGGGTDLLGRWLLSCFTQESKLLYYNLQTHHSYESFTHDQKSNKRVTSTAKILRPPAPVLTPQRDVNQVYYSGNLIILMNPGSFSATDNFIATAKDNLSNVYFVGDENGAGSGAPRYLITLPHSKAKVRLCFMRVTRKDGSFIEGNPIQPDVLVEWTQQDILDAKDADLEAALQLAESL